MSLVPLVAGLCPSCGEVLEQFVSEQPALFVHGGYGATERTRMQRCPGCGWEVRSEVSEVRPPRRVVGEAS